MKNRFIEYHIADHLEEIYSDAIIVLDTNSLLNLYRYSEETRKKYFEILLKVKSRLFLTEQVSLEFYKNRYTLIANRTLFIQELNDLLNSYHEKLLNILKNSSGENKYNAALSILKHEEELRTTIIKEIEHSSEKINQQLNYFKQDIDFKYIQGKDPILAEIIEIFKEKISEGFSDKEKEKIYTEGEKRYSKKIPPGYKDETKEFPDKYGDLIVWKELQRISKKLKKHILFISDDRKEDWVIKFKGMNLGPRKELIKEFYRETKNLFYSISTKEFIKLISEKYKVENIENLEKETEIIYNKIQDDNRIKSEIINNFINQQQELSQEKRNSLENFEKQQEMLRKMRSPLEDFEKQQEMLRKIRNPLEDFEKQQEMLRKMRNPLEDFEKQQEMLQKMRNPLENLEKQQELLRKMRNPLEDFEEEGRKQKKKSNKKNKK